MRFFILDFLLVDDRQLRMMKKVIYLVKTKYYTFVDISNLKSTQVLVILRLKLTDRDSLPLLEHHFECLIHIVVLYLCLRIWT